MNNDKNIPADTEAYYETLASQEELYLEETEEEVFAVLTADDLQYEPSGECSCENREEREIDWEVEGSAAGPDDGPRKVESVDERLDHAAEELITGDSDDPPLSEETILEVLRVGWNIRRLGP
jgi:hypothetical protein